MREGPPGCGKGENSSRRRDFRLVMPFGGQCLYSASVPPNECVWLLGAPPLAPDIIVCVKVTRSRSLWCSRHCFAYKCVSVFFRGVRGVWAAPVPRCAATGARLFGPARLQGAGRM